MTIEEKDTLTLKWGTLKAWDFKTDTEEMRAAIERLNELPWSMSAAAQVMTDDHKEALCAAIDAANLDYVYNDWEGTEMTKEEAKKYVREYHR